MVKFHYAFFLILLLFGISFVEASITGESVTGEIITGDVTSRDVSLSIRVISTSTPSIDINSPSYGTYFSNSSLLLNYRVSNAHFVWYNLNEGSNKSISNSSSEIYFNVGEGSNILYLYANNTYGESTDNVSFMVNLTKFTVLYSKLSSSGWSSTDFNSSSYEEIQSLSDVVFENHNYGKISFFDSINITNDSNPGDSFVDLDSNVNISFNRIEINSSALPNFNKSAQLKLYNLTFSDPRILKDGSLCSSIECQKVSYSGGTLIFNVTEFSVYSAEETPASVIPSGGGGGGGEPTNVEETTKEDIYFSVENLKFFLKQGESLKKSFIVANNGEKDVKFDIFVSESLKDLISLVEPYHTLSSGDSKVMVVQSFSGEENSPDLYIGHLIFDFGDFKKFLSIVVQIESKNSLFDVELFLSREKKKFLPGDNLNFIVSLRNMAGDPKLGDVSLEYLVKDSNGNLILSSQESYAVETTASKEATLKLPSDLIRGKYYVYVKVDYKGGTALAYQEFFVRSFPLTNVVYKGGTALAYQEFFVRSFPLTNVVYGSIVLFSLFLLFVVFFLIMRNRNNRKISRNKP